MACNKEKEVLLCILEMYKDMPYLWQQEHKDYMNKDMRAEAFKVLLGIYKNFDENATVKTIKKKIENMRTSYAKELKKVQASKHTGAGADEVYVPTLWYFDALNFLGSRTESCRTVTDSLDNEKSSSEDETASVTNSSSGSRKRKKKDTLLQKQENILLAAERIMAQKDEEWEIYGRSIGFHVKDLNKRQKIIAQKIISDVLFHAKLDQLTESSCVVLNPFHESIPNNSGFYQRQKQFYSPSPPSNYSSPSPSSQTQSPHHSISHFTPWPRFHTQSVRQPIPSPQHQTQLPNSPSPYQLSSNHHTQTVHQPLQSPQNQTQLSTSPLPHQPTFDNVVTVDNNTQFLEYLPNVNTADENSGSLPVIEGPGELMKEFLIVKRTN